MRTQSSISRFADLLTIVIVAVAAHASACSQVLDLRDPTLKDAAAVSDDAPPDVAQVDSSPADTGSPACAPADCPFGCEPSSPTYVCRPAKLWIYATTGLYVGDDFGGKDGTVRATSDTLCFETASIKYATRGCSRSRTHAVLFVAQGDSIPLMTINYGIPTDAPVHRADDDARVFATWNDLIDTTNTKPPAVPVTKDQPGIVWSGALGSATCRAWTSSLSTQVGNQGDTTAISANWLSRKGANACDQLAKLLCICWTGGE